MHRQYRCLHVLVAAISLLVSCQILPTQSVNQAEAEAIPYRRILGKNMEDRSVLALLAVHPCTSADPFHICQEAGMALWMDADHVVKKVFLYLDNSEGFSPYKGELPFGLKFYDIQGAVEYKLNKLGVGKSGLPDEGGTPDHQHYWAFYREYGVTIIYNSPFPDEDATIYAVLVES